MRWQEWLWAVPNGLTWWDGFFGMIAATTAIVSFATMILGHPLNALVASRSVVACGLMMGALIPLNSGAAKWSFATIVVGLAMSNFLLLTKWCERAHPWRDMGAAIAQMLGRALDAVAPRSKDGPSDHIAHGKDD
jgi:hypothetical protein